MQSDSAPPASSPQPVAVVTGSSAGLGLVIAETFLRNSYRVVVTGRDSVRLSEARDHLVEGRSDRDVLAVVGDLAINAEVVRLFEQIHDEWGRIDVLVNCVGMSDRGLGETLSPERLQELFTQNVTTALLCSQAALPLLEKSRGAIINIGSLASKVGARYIGGYAAAKHAIAGLSQQMRLELKPKGVHVGLVSPGPIRRDDAGNRYQKQMDESLPAQASQPGGGTTIKGLDPQVVADAVYRAATRRLPDLVLPRHMRLLIALGHAVPKLGDWLLLKFTSSKES